MVEAHLSVHNELELSGWNYMNVAASLHLHEGISSLVASFTASLWIRIDSTKRPHAVV